MTVLRVEVREWRVEAWRCPLRLCLKLELENGIAVVLVFVSFELL